jgi:diguanylate cyclase (GGDEF)-like protein
MALGFGRRRRSRRQGPKEEPQAAPQEPEHTSERQESLQPVLADHTDEPARAEASENPATSDKPEHDETAAAAPAQVAPVAAIEKAHPAPATRRGKAQANGDRLSLLNALLRLHGAEDMASLSDAADQLARTYLGGTHLLVLLIDKGGSFHLRLAKAGATGTLIKRLGELLEIDMSREIPPPRRGRMAKIWLDDSTSAQATSLADFWGDSAGEETCWRAEKTLGISQVTAIRLASTEEPLGIALFISPGDPPDPAMLDAVGRHVTVALANVRSIEKARQFGTVDPIRWIPDGNEFNRQLSREVSRARRYGHAVSVVLLVVDNFDTLRLEYGWTVANRLLRSVGSGLTEHLRESDYMGAYRHNGFGVILVQTAGEGALEAAARLRGAAQDVRVLEGDDGPVPECVVATASCPEDGGEANALLLAAESRLLPKRRLSSASA